MSTTIAESPNPTTTVIAVDDQRSLTIVKHDNGQIESESTLLGDEEETTTEDHTGTIEAISDLMLEYEYGGAGGEQPIEQKYPEIAARICERYISDPYTDSVNAIEAFIIMLTAHGIDVSGFGPVLSETLDTLANRLA